MIEHLSRHVLRAYGVGDMTLALVKFDASAGSISVTDRLGVRSITRAGAGDYDLTLPRGKQYYSWFGVYPNAAGDTDLSVHVTAEDASAGTMSIGLAPAGPVYLHAQIPDISTADFCYTPVPIAGTLTKIWSIIHGTIATSDVVLTTDIGTTAVTNGAITVANAGSAAGDVDSATPTAANTLAAGDNLNTETDGASTNTVPVDIVYEIAPAVADPVGTVTICGVILVRGI